MMTEKPLSPFLLGAGIVRGLTVTRQTDQNIVLESGYGYSSEGIPFFCEETLFRHYKPLSLNNEPALAKYFFNKNAPTTDFKFWELLTDKDSHATETHGHKLIRLLKPQSPTNTEGYIFLDDKVVILYRNSEKEPLRVLLMLKKYVALVTFPDSFKWQDIVKQDTNGDDSFSIWGDSATTSDPSKDVSDHDLYAHLHPVLQLPVLAIRRFGYGELALEDFSCDEIYETLFCRTDAKKGNLLINFESVCTEYTLIIDKISCELEESLCVFHVHFGGILGKNAVSTLDTYWKNTEKRWQAFKEQKSASDKTAMQYWYDVFADLTTAYNELRAEALKIEGQIEGQMRGETKPFTRHLLLGSLPAEPNLAFPNPFRTVYQQPPIFNGQAEQLQRVRFLHWRLVMMMKCFFAPAFDWDDGATDSTLAPTDTVNADNPLDIAAKINLPIRLTPSRPLSMPLGQRAIPFYFDLTKSEQSLHWYWDFEATQQNRMTEHLSYHSENEAAFVKQKEGEYYAGTEGDTYSQVPHVVHPFAFDLRAYPFVRIEGHVGKTVTINAQETGKPIDFKMPNSKGEIKPIKEILADLTRQYNICFNVELLPTSALKPIAATPNTPAIPAFCGKCLEHLGGVYHGGTFLIFYEEMTPTNLERAAPKTYKIVADFTYLK